MHRSFTGTAGYEFNKSLQQKQSRNDQNIKPRVAPHLRRETNREFRTLEKSSLAGKTSTPEDMSDNEGSLQSWQEFERHIINVRHGSTEIKNKNYPVITSVNPSKLFLLVRDELLSELRESNRDADLTRPIISTESKKNNRSSISNEDNEANHRNPSENLMEVNLVCRKTCRNKDNDMNEKLVRSHKPVKLERTHKWASKSNGDRMKNNMLYQLENADSKTEPYENNIYVYRKNDNVCNKSDLSQDHCNHDLERRQDNCICRSRCSNTDNLNPAESPNSKNFNPDKFDYFSVNENTIKECSIEMIEEYVLQKEPYNDVNRKAGRWKSIVSRSIIKRDGGLQNDIRSDYETKISLDKIVTNSNPNKNFIQSISNDQSSTPESTLSTSSLTSPVASQTSSNKTSEDQSADIREVINYLTQGVSLKEYRAEQRRRLYERYIHGECDKWEDELTEYSRNSLDQIKQQRRRRSLAASRLPVWKRPVTTCSRLHTSADSHCWGSMSSVKSPAPSVNRSVSAKARMISSFNG